MVVLEVVTVNIKFKVNKILSSYTDFNLRAADDEAAVAEKG